MFKYFLFVILLAFGLPASSQLPVLQWAKSFIPHNEYNPSVYSNGRSIAVDQMGNVYTAGQFDYTMDLDPGPGVYALTASTWANTSIYISKLSPTGEFMWAIQIPTFIEFGNIELKVDKDNNIYIVSELRLPTDFDPGPGVYTLTPIGAIDSFVAKYDPNGNLIWAKQFGGPGDTVPRPDVLDIDNNNNIIIGGNFNNTVDFDPGPGIFNITSTAHIQSYVVKLNSNGDFIWAKQFGNSPVVYSGSSIGDVKCDSKGNIYMVGEFTGSCDFDPGPGSYLIASTSSRDGYIAKLDPNGNFTWAKRIGNTTGDYYQIIQSHGIDVDAYDNVYAIGFFTGTFDFDPGPGTRIISSSSYDWYLLKLNGDGQFLWADTFGGSEDDIGADVAVGTDGNIYAIGTIGHTADMDPGSGVYPITTENTYGASALVKVNAEGNLIYATPFNGPPGLPRRIVVDNLQNIYITGYIQGTVDFDPGPGVYQVSSWGDMAPFVLKLGRCLNATTSTLNINACSSYVLNNETFDSTGTYIRTIPNSGGCDSIITLNLTINKRFTQQTKSICEGDSFFAGGSNQTTAGVYFDTLHTIFGCDSIVSTHLTVSAKPYPDLGPDKSICKNMQLIISPGSFSNYLWQDGSIGSSFIVKDPGIYWVKVSNTYNCIAADTFSVASLLDLPSKFLKPADSICSYGGLEIAPTNIYPSYAWSTGATDRTIVVETPGIYWLKVMNTSGCFATDSITVFPKECMHGVYIPTAFTPNGDGRNDVFRALLFGKVKQYRLTVYNRWGAIVFQTTDPQRGWDGKVAGVLPASSSFVWTCTYQLEGMVPNTEKGTVTLIR